ncbi:MAG: gamma-glutamylcyclotransferase family protein [Ginsengibacter sp.]
MSHSTSNRLFVYSSLRKGFQQADYDYIAEFFSFISDAKVEGTLSILNHVPVATNGATNTFIKGELYEIKNEQNISYVMGQLDGYEGLVVEENEIPLYRRELTKVFLNDGSESEAWVYWYNGDVSGLPIIPSGDVFDFIEIFRNSHSE